MGKKLKFSILYLFMIFSQGCTTSEEQAFILDVNGKHPLVENQVWLSHEHILVDFIGADSIRPDTWDHDAIIHAVMPYLDELKEFKVDYFVDATPAYLGRDALLLKKVADLSGIKILTNTGLYGARNNIFIPAYALEMTAAELAEIWIHEYNSGIDGTSVKPGFIKIGIDASDPLDPMHQKLVEAAVLTHLKTGLIIASHTGKARGLWPQLRVLKEYGVSPESFIWVHAQEEDDHDNYLKAAGLGCWISLDGLGWELEKHLEKILFAKSKKILDRILLSHDAGWYDPQKDHQTIIPFTDIFTKLYPLLKSNGLTDEEWMMLISVNPAKAFSLPGRTVSP